MIYCGDVVVKSSALLFVRSVHGTTSTHKSCYFHSPGNIIVPDLGIMEFNIHGRINHSRNDKSQKHKCFFIGGRVLCRCQQKFDGFNDCLLCLIC
jgi:hypothetical protein